ncbi:putative baseplate assembly protein [Methyloterricola oryzae]|uniref:putative baseplate assembly protein n=1 Tax=Methyloterricola oryzae TaxID=1495050 RepID=UPI0005EBC2C0|nr:putative baseplate assembly protein [Methyloterricola oryzae]
MNLAALKDQTAFLDQRRQAVAAHGRQIGIDFVDVIGPLNEGQPSRWLLILHFIRAKGDDAKLQIPAKPDSIPLGSIRITTGSGTPANNIRVVEAPTQGEVNDQLIVTIEFDAGSTRGAGIYGTYTLKLLGIENLDPFFDSVDFSLNANLPGNLDPLKLVMSLPAQADPTEIDYLAKDYASFRQLMLNRLDLLLPDWKERHEADIGNVLVEILAYAADQLSYYQDAVATEAYLETARQRISVRRHARLVDYAMHEGCNARVWVQIQVNVDIPHITLEAGTRLLRSAGAGPVMDSQSFKAAIDSGADGFATLHPAELYSAHNQIEIYTWGAKPFVLPQGSVAATLRDKGLALQIGDVLIFEQIRNATSSSADGADFTLRHPLRLTQVVASRDPLADTPIVDVAWQVADALPFDLAIADGNGTEPLAVVRGNIVLADHGVELTESLPPVPLAGRYRPALAVPGLTHAVPYDDAKARSAAAKTELSQDPRLAVPQIVLHDGKFDWPPRPDLLDSDAFSTAFVAEMQNDGKAQLRFGDGTWGIRPEPEIRFQARYRAGNGPSGNVGPESITHLITDEPGITGAVVAVRNPLAAQGGISPESINQVRQAAPWAYKTQERCVATADYEAMAMRHPEVLQAAAVLRWTGSWYTAFVSVLRRDGRPVDDAFRQEMRQFLERYRLAGVDIEVSPPRYVALDILLPVKVAAQSFRSTIRQSLQEAFSTYELSKGRRGFFHFENFGFGQPVFLSQLVTTAMNIPGVVRVDIAAQNPQQTPPRFRRWGRNDAGELREGRIAVGPLEVIRLENNAAAPENGMIDFALEGGI